MRRVYLDHNATTPLGAGVFEAMRPFLAESYGNPSSLHAFGQEARHAVERARSQVASLLGVEPREVVFTSGGTESDNLAIRGVVGAASSAGRAEVHVLCSAIEHPAVRAPCEALGKEFSGVRAERFPVSEGGIVRVDELARRLVPETALVSAMLANNEIGTLQPVREIATICRERGILVHTDAVQAVGKIPVRPVELGVDLLSLSAHKIGGPKGVGALWIRKGVKLRPLVSGGHQERELRTGTENVAGIVGFGAACEATAAELTSYAERVRTRRDRFEARIQSEVGRVRLNGDRERRVANTANIGFEGLDAEAIVLGLDLEGIACSAGSACASGAIEPSPVLLALGQSSRQASSAVRFSLGQSTTDEAVNDAVEALKRVVARLRQTAPAPA